MEEPASTINPPPLEWGAGKVRLECVFLGKTHRFEHVGAFARIGSDPRCELCIPELPAPVCVYLQIARDYVAVLELVDCDPISLCEPIYALPGATVWLQPNARITVESIKCIDRSEPKAENFSWENFNVDDIKVFPNTLLARSGYFSAQSQPTHLRLQYALSVLGSSPSCQLRIAHKHVGRFQAVIFRGEHQGESCRVVDLLTEHPTLVDNQIAKGQVLEVGSQLNIANLNLEAVRLLYNASRPSQIVEVRTQFSTLPLSVNRETASDRSAIPKRDLPSQGSESSNNQRVSLPDLQNMKDRLAKAIGFDAGQSSAPKVHFPLEQDHETSVKTRSENDFDPRVADGLDRVAKSQERMASEFEKLAMRLQGVEESLGQLPEILNSNSQQLADSIESIKELIHQTALTNPTPLSNSIANDLKSRNNSPATLEKANRAAIPKKVEKVDRIPTKQQPTTRSKPATITSNKTATQKEGKRERESDLSMNEIVLSWIQRARSFVAHWIPNFQNRYREIAERSEGNDALNLGSQTTAKRTRLQHIDDESELLSASESEDETLVLGSLMGLRYRDARKSFFRWTFFALALLLTALVGGPLIWNQIPEGWRELIWQRISLTATPKESEYVPDFESQPIDSAAPNPQAPEDPIPSTAPAISTEPEPSASAIP